ncbi:MAG: hypothetical protein ABR589_10280 [Chthoniobacterales bacterium]
MSRFHGRAVLRLRSGALFVLLLACFAGCSFLRKSQLAKSSGEKLFAVTADNTSFYRYSPQQVNGADQELAKDTLVKLIRPSLGYSKVQLVENAEEGYVPSESIKRAPATLVAALTAPAPQIALSSPDPEDFDIGSSEPPPPEALPDAEAATAPAQATSP